MAGNVGGIVKNTAFLYVRMFLLMFVGLYTSRILLQALGIQDLGIYNVVGSVIVMLEFVSTSLTNSSQRYLNIGLGKNDMDLTKKYFSQSFGLHLLLSIGIVIVLETVGLWLLNTKLNIPADRRTAAVWVYHLSVLIAFVKINMICYQSVLIARESMSVYAYLSIFEAIAKLLVIYLIKTSHFDRLIYYGALCLAIQVMVFLVHAVYCHIKYEESRYKYYWDKALCKEMLSFFGVNAFGYISWAVGLQGVDVVLNIFLGPVVNGARGLSSTVGRFINQFVNNIYLAVKPQLIKSYAKGEMEEMISLAEKSTTYIFYLVLIVSMPLFLETNFILTVWLKKVPQYVEMYTKLALLQSFFWMLPIPYGQISVATGRIKNIQLYGRIFTLLALPLSYLLLRMNKNPYYPVYALMAMDAFFWLYTIYDVNKQLEIKFKRYFSNVIQPIVLVTAFLFGSMWAVHHFLHAGEAVKFLIEGVLSVALGLAFSCTFGMSKSDVVFLKGVVLKKIRK